MWVWLVVCLFVLALIDWWPAHSTPFLLPCGSWDSPTLEVAAWTKYIITNMCTLCFKQTCKIKCAKFLYSNFKNMNHFQVGLKTNKQKKTFEGPQSHWSCENTEHEWKIWSQFQNQSKIIVKPLKKSSFLVNKCFNSSVHPFSNYGKHVCHAVKVQLTYLILFYLSCGSYTFSSPPAGWFSNGVFWNLNSKIKSVFPSRGLGRSSMVRGNYWPRVQSSLSAVKWKPFLL